ncbi:methyl-accepting chemotaxis protein II [Erwinia sp. OLTSP20]|uniref:methyl-accepting chemotaxis protein n=1 Tax=unclassified Erwinia TaxID=2622719 RepID=UPI000C18B95A|nr:MULTISPECIES: methyl-accepting chemotaxis protein [unclassified Erwinia]PIJ50498.1 methyl-accepting chemotaxis protein II [Erwinia sp. OAMSP11]PIJ72592.1 methyl-accepting chemotaxis protein II [Erwinia sp. OLSSP12]PIJ82072.1 methyl-accepting chemotaxis protein II [Erwinia sp. OLCASP19]PIJ84954.1 methyl-accepting chemotaxis protein II [Erwinia sp. OLMTSP26]PIJ86558.1 methyl-accepting chemotaxis protein II [Erwinia sp. OLMDSP33]
MFKNTKIVTGITVILVISGVLWLSIAGLYYTAVNSDRVNFINNEQLSRQQLLLNDSVHSLIISRVAITRVAVHFLENQNNPDSASQADFNDLLQKASVSLAQSAHDFQAWQAYVNDNQHDAAAEGKLRQTYQALYDVLKNSVAFLREGHYSVYTNLGAQEAQDDLIACWNAWREKNYQLQKLASQQNHKNYSQMKLLLATIAVVLVILVVTIYSGIRQILFVPLRLITTHINAITQGDLTSPIEDGGRSEMGHLLNRLSAMQRALITTVGAVRESADAIYSEASEISAGGNDLSSRTEEQAASLEQTAASMEQLSAAVKFNSDNARQAADLAHIASTTAEKGGTVVSGVVATMQEISDSSQQISRITAVIDEIAFQTNILALNAAVEAARAGEQGRGFAVVAGEVRSLAGRSATAAKEIKALIDKSASRVDSGSKQVSDAGHAMEEIVVAVNRVTSIMEEIATASDEQRRGIEQISLAVSQMDSVTQQNAALVEESAGAASTLEIQAAQLRQAVSVFHIAAADLNRTATMQEMTPGLTTSTTPLIAQGPATQHWEAF